MPELPQPSGSTPGESRVTDFVYDTGILTALEEARTREQLQPKQRQRLRRGGPQYPRRRPRTGQ